MQDRPPLVAETGLQGLPRYYGDYPYRLMLSLRRCPKGRGLRDLAGDIGAMPQDIAQVEAALGYLVTLDIAEKVETMDKETVWVWRTAI